MAKERMNDLLTPPEAAELIGVGRTTVWNWIRDGKIDAESVGRGRVAIRRAVALLAQARVNDAKERGDRRWGAVRAQG